jgi:hypothetical protein
MKIAKLREIKIQKPIKSIPIKPSEKMSKKNPPIKAAKSPELFLGFSKRLTRMTVIKMRFKA